MKITFFSLATCLLCTLGAGAQGVRFYGGEAAIDHRTSLDVFGKHAPLFSNHFEVGFDLQLYTDWPVGYIMRLKGGEGKVWNLFFDGRGPNLRFCLNEEGRHSLITADIERAAMPAMSWNRVDIEFDMLAGTIGLSLGGRTFMARGVALPQKIEPRLFWGLNEYVIDIPSMSIKNIQVSGDQQHYAFPLTESTGTVVHSAQGSKWGTVKNHEWMINDHYHWRQLDSFSSSSVAGALYDEAGARVLYLNRDTLHIYKVRTRTVEVYPLAEPCPVELTLGTCFLSGGRIYVYEVFGSSAVSAASLDIETLQWREESRQHLPHQLHHHSAIVDSSCLHIFGGFGDMHFSHNFHTFNTQNGTWSTASSTIMPRYFSSMGSGEGSTWLFGGMGNESGEQVVGRDYFYDLHRVDPATGHSEKLWEIPWADSTIVPVRNMIVPGDGHFYTLLYPEYHSQSLLQLYRFSIVDGTHTAMADSIPIRSDRITTNASIHYDSLLERLFVMVQEFQSDDKANSLKIYSLSFPPITANMLTDQPASHSGSTLQYLVALFSLSAIMGVIGFKWRNASRRHRLEKQRQRLRGSERHVRPNAVYLFGNFAVIDRTGRDITYMFSSRLRQIFCLILQHSLGEGIQSRQMSAIMWPDKPENKVKNIRSVTINHLRKVLCELDDVEVLHEKGRYRVVFGERFHCDSLRVMSLISSETVEDNRGEFRRLVARGKLMEFMDGEQFDPHKEALERLLEPILLKLLEKSFDAEEHAATLELVSALYHIDPLSEDALQFQIRTLQRLGCHNEAHLRHLTFAAEYKKIMGTDYPKAYKKAL